MLVCVLIGKAALIFHVTLLWRAEERTGQGVLETDSSLTNSKIGAQIHHPAKLLQWPADRDVISFRSGYVLGFYGMCKYVSNKPKVYVLPSLDPNPSGACKTVHVS